MNKKIEFDNELWAKLILLRNKGVKLSRTYLKENYQLSDRVAYAYLFALNNKGSLVKELDSAKKLTRINEQLKDSKANVKKLLSENETLEGKINFLIAIDSNDVEQEDLHRIPLPKNSEYRDEITSISLLSDIHFEETVEPSLIDYINEYNPSIAIRRTTLYFTRLLWMINSLRKGGFNIKNHVLAILGDVINGYIHEEFIEMNAMSPIEASMQIESLLIDGIRFLVDNGEFETLHVIMTRGNHGRTTTRKRYSSGYKNSYEYMIYHNIRKWFATHGYENVMFIIPDGEFVHMKVYDKMLSFSHGDHFGYRGGIGGVLIPFKGFMYKHNKIVPVDKYFIGHWHTSENIKEGMINGSVIGYNSFAMGHSFAPEPPMQWLQLLDSKRGFTIATPIILEDW